MSRRALAAGLTALAFVLRVRGMGQSLFGDEVLTYQNIDHGSLVDVLRALRAAPESTPPLHYALAWAAGRLSGALTDIRLPSLLAGTATVPLLLAVGRRLVPGRAAWLAAAAFALSPFATRDPRRPTGHRDPRQPLHPQDPNVDSWLAEHPRWQMVFTPKHASWLNQVEIFFSILTRGLLKHGQFKDTDDLATQMLAFFEHHNLTARQFKWTYTGKVLAR